jgi:hypothetical protein
MGTSFSDRRTSVKGNRTALRMDRRNRCWRGWTVWGVATFLVVPVLVAERKGPFDALEESVQLLRRTWGENLLAGISFGALYFLWSLPGILTFVIGAGLMVSHLYIGIIIMALAILYFPLLGVLLSTMSTIFDVVLYRYAKHGTISPGFDRELLATSFVQKIIVGTTT